MNEEEILSYLVTITFAIGFVIGGVFNIQRPESFILFFGSFVMLFIFGYNFDCYQGGKRK